MTLILKVKLEPSGGRKKDGRVGSNSINQVERIVYQRNSSVSP